MTTRNRLTNQQRDQLTQFLITHEDNIEKYDLTYEHIAHSAGKVLGFPVTVSNVGYAYYLMDLPEGEDAEPPVEATPAPSPAPVVEVRKYEVLNATATHGRIKPWELSEQDRSIELLERVRRLETMVKKISQHFGLDDPLRQQMPLFPESVTN